MQRVSIFLLVSFITRSLSPAIRLPRLRLYNATQYRRKLPRPDRTQSSNTRAGIFPFDGSLPHLPKHARPPLGFPMGARSVREIIPPSQMRHPLLSSNLSTLVHLHLPLVRRAVGHHPGACGDLPQPSSVKCLRSSTPLNVPGQWVNG